jgi:hypothetical protein
MAILSGKYEVWNRKWTYRKLFNGVPNVVIPFYINILDNAE